MSDNYKDKDIERIIFRDGLESSEIEPSEKFWNKSFEGILQRENRTYLNRVMRLRGTLVIMGTVILLLTCYAVYMHNEVNDVKQQLTRVESNQIKSLQQNDVAKTTEKILGSNGNLQKNIRQQNKLPAIASINKASSSTFAIKVTKNPHYTNTNASSYILPIATKQVSNVILNSTETILNNSLPTINKSSSGENASVLTSAKATINNTISQNENKSDSNSVHNQSLATQLSKPLVVNKKTDSLAAALALDSANALSLNKKPITLKDMLSKSSVSAFYAPGITDDFLNYRNNDPTNTITANALKTRQDGDGTYALGLRLAYDISDRWTIQTGCYYSLYSYNINPTIVYAQQQENGQVGYSITTTSGTVFLPYSAGSAHIGDSIKVKGSSSRGYLSIPLQAKYKFAVGTKFSTYLTGGFAVNIANYQETEIHWENTALQEGDLSVNSIYGLNTVQYTYNLGFGAAYLIRRGISIYVEPFVDGSFTSINKNTPVIIYPYFFGLALGVTYHF